MKRMIYCLLLAACFQGCAPRGPAKHDRKKVPNLDELGVGDYTPEESLTAPGVPFTVHHVDVQTADGIAPYVAVSLPDETFDTLAMNLVRNNVKMAVPLLADWASREKEGLLIDLRNTSSGQGHRQDFLIGDGRQFSVPVVFLWDVASSDRAARFMRVLNAVPNLNCQSSTYAAQNNF